MADQDFSAVIYQHLQRLTAGSFLFSTKLLTDDNFRDTVILICQHSHAGSYGLVLNRPSHMPLSEVFGGISIKSSPSIVIYIGGPVQSSELQILHITNEPVSNALRVTSGIYLGGNWENIESIITCSSSELKLFLGYAGWGGGQLEHEIKLGAWEVWNPDPQVILKNTPERAWGDLKNLKNLMSGNIRM